MSSTRILDSIKVARGAGKVASHLIEIHLGSLEKSANTLTHGRDVASSFIKASSAILNEKRNNEKKISINGEGGGERNPDRIALANLSVADLKTPRNAQHELERSLPALAITDKSRFDGRPTHTMKAAEDVTNRLTLRDIDFETNVEPQALRNKNEIDLTPNNPSTAERLNFNENLSTEIQSESNNKSDADEAEENKKQTYELFAAETNAKRNFKSRKVPSSPLARVLGFGQLAVGLAVGTVAEALRQGVGPSKPSVSQLITSDANAERLAEALCRMRGAALKLGQILSIQDEGLIPPQLARALERVRAGADAMPQRQLHSQLSKGLGPDWREKFFDFDERPIAAASIGQVHKARLSDGSVVAIKIQYPGVADSIESDLSNLERLVTMTNMLPPGLFVEEIIEVARAELKLECDYELEAANQRKFKRFVGEDPNLSPFVSVPRVYDEITTKQILATELVEGVHIDRIAGMSQEVRNSIARLLLRITVNELFVWRFMQTDPNWGNYLYDPSRDKLHLIDFGACREYPTRFVDSYLNLVWSAANRDEAEFIRLSRELGFLTGEESDVMLRAHVSAGMVVGEPFVQNVPFDFSGSNLTGRIQKHGQVFAKHRLTPPPREVYSLHRKLAGAFLACIKLRATIECRDILEETYAARCNGVIQAER